MRRYLALTPLLLLALAPAPGAAEDVPPRFNVVDIRPSSTSIYIGIVTMYMPPFVRKNTVFSSTYSAKVFPYFFYNETGRIWIVVPEHELHAIDHGSAIDFTGSAISASGDKRRVEGKAMPTGPTTGRIRVKVYVTRKIALTYETTYELKGAPIPVTAR